MGKMGTQQMSGGVWHLSWSGGEAYVWSRDGGRDELWASATPNFLPLQNDFTATKTTEDPDSDQDFITWVCSQYTGNPKLYVVQQASVFTPYQGGTYQCS